MLKRNSNKGAATAKVFMWQDYVGIIPGVAAAVLGVVTFSARHVPVWKKFVITALTLVAIGATGFSQWWTLHQRKIEQDRRSQIEERLGEFIGEGEKWMAIVSSQPGSPVPENEINDWANRTESFLKKLGNSYVIRFRSTAGLNTSLSLTGADKTHNAYWLGLRARITRLNAFASEFAGQIPSQPSDPF